jgi:hypothetical protein
MIDLSYEQLSSFNEESTESEIEIPDPAAKRKRGSARIWIKEQEFESKDLVLDFVKKEVSEDEIFVIENDK